MERAFSPPTLEDLGLGVLFGSIRDAVIVGDAESGRIVLWNPAAEALFGYSRADAVGMLMEDLVPERLREAHRAGLARYAAGESGPLINATRPIEVPALRRDGEEIAIELTLNPLEETRVPGRFVLALIRDATARKEAELALEGERFLLHALLANLPDAVYFKDAQHRFIRVNPAAAALYGLDNPDAAVGLTDFDVFPEEQARQFWEDERPVIEAGTALVNRLEHQADAGDVQRWTLATKVPIMDTEGHVTGLVGISRDISDLVQAEAAQRQSEERFRTAFDQAAIGMSVVDVDGQYLQVNAALCALTGYTEAELLARTFQDITHPDDLGSELVQVEHLLAGETAAFQREKRYLRKDGAVIWIRLNTALVRDEHGTPLAFIGQVEDITDRKAVEEERNRLHTELEAEFARAAEIQAQLLPHAAPDLPGYEFAGICLPARQVGGDFYDWLAGDDAIRLSLGDVMGKGMPASLLTATVRAALRVVEDLPVSAAVEAVNRALSPDLMHTDSFVTLFHAALEPATGELTYVDAGHGLDFIQRRDGTVEPLRQHGVPLGVLPNATYPAGTITLQPGDTLVIYSDGLPDARPELRLDPVGVGAQIEELPTAQAKLERLVSLVSDIQTRPDDLTLVLLHRREEGVIMGDPVVADVPARAGVA